MNSIPVYEDQNIYNFETYIIKKIYYLSLLKILFIFMKLKNNNLIFNH